MALLRYDNEIPVSVPIITCNEENNIEFTLESIKDFEDIVIIDSFSKDRTSEKCKKFTDSVFQHRWQGFSKQKQLSVDYTKKEWVLILVVGSTNYRDRSPTNEVISS